MNKSTDHKTLVLTTPVAKGFLMCFTRQFFYASCDRSFVITTQLAGIASFLGAKLVLLSHVQGANDIHITRGDISLLVQYSRLISIASLKTLVCKIQSARFGHGSFDPLGKVKGIARILYLSTGAEPLTAPKEKGRITLRIKRKTITDAIHIFFHADAV